MIESSAFYPYRVHWRETLATGVSATLVVATTFFLLHGFQGIPSTPLVQYTCLAIDVGSLLALAKSSSALKKKVALNHKKKIPSSSVNGNNHRAPTALDLQIPPKVAVTLPESSVETTLALVALSESSSQSQPVTVSSLVYTTVAPPPEPIALPITVFENPPQTFEELSEPINDESTTFSTESNTIGLVVPSVSVFENPSPPFAPFSAPPTIVMAPPKEMDFVVVTSNTSNRNDLETMSVSVHNFDAIKKESAFFLQSFDSAAQAFIKAFYNSKKRVVLFGSPAESKKQEMAKNFNVIRETFNTIMNDPVLVFRTGLNLLPPNVDKTELKHVFAQDDDINAIHHLLATLSQNETSQAYFGIFIQKVTDSLYKSSLSDEITSSFKNLRQAYHSIKSATNDEEKAKAILSFDKLLYTLLDHLFLRAHIPVEEVRTWSQELSTPILNMFQLETDEICKQLRELAKEFSPKGIFNSAYILNAIKQKVGKGTIFGYPVASIAKMGITSWLGLKVINWLFIQPKITEKLEPVILPINQNEFNQAIKNIVAMLLEPVLYGLFTDKDPLRIRMEQIVDSQEVSELVKKIPNMGAETIYSSAGAVLSKMGQLLDKSTFS